MRKIIFLFGFLLFCFGIYLLIDGNSKEISSNTHNLNEDPTPSPIVQQKTEWSLTAVGDIMLSRNVESVMLKQTEKYDYPYLKTKDLLVGSSVFANLETPLIDGPAVPSGTMVFRSATANAKALAEAGFNVVSLANNHTPNKSQAGLISTFSSLTDAKILYVGAGINVAEAYSPKVQKISNDFSVAWLAYNDRDVVPESYGAGTTSKGLDWAGTALMNESKLEEEIAKAKTLANYVIVSMHSGREYTAVPNTSQTTFAHRAIDAGADLVIGHHPHVVQSVEKYQEKYIFYSLGNFIFDQMFSDETRRGIMLNFIFEDKNITQIEIIPTVIENYTQPRVASTKEAQWIIDRLKITTTTKDDKYFVDLNSK